jgi:hypothetical protein
VGPPNPFLLQALFIKHLRRFAQPDDRGSLDSGFTGNQKTGIKAALLPKYRTRKGKTMGQVQTGDVKLYYEVHGSGEPLLMIMGLGSSSATWSPVLIAEL